MSPLTRALTEMFPEAAEHYPHLVAAMAEFGIDTPERCAAFLAQLHHESRGLTRLEEGFSYQAARLMEVWPFRFRTIAVAREWASKPREVLASYVYANRMGNGSVTTRDGWNYRGRGFIQLTGKNNYAEFGEALNLPLVESPSLAAFPPHAARIAARFWATRGCNAKADAGDFQAITRAINGGLTDHKSRVATWQRFRAILGIGAA